MKDAGQRVRMVFLEKRIGFRFVQKRKQSLGNNGPRGAASVAALEERHRIERLFRGDEMQHVGFPIEDNREMVFGVFLKCANRKVKISRRKREQEVSIRLLLNGDRFGVETRDCRRKENGGIARFPGDRNGVDDKFIERLLHDLSRGELRGDQQSECERAFHSGLSLYLKSCTTSGSRPLASRSGFRMKRNSIENFNGSRNSIWLSVPTRMRLPSVRTLTVS